MAIFLLTIGITDVVNTLKADMDPVILESLTLIIISNMVIKNVVSWINLLLLFTLFIRIYLYDSTHIIIQIGAKILLNNWKGLRAYALLLNPITVPMA